MAVTQNSKVNSTLSPRIAELQKKIQDSNYVDNAIDRIAVIMSRHIVGSHSITGNTADFLIQ